ncbi:MAG: DoxX family protein [Flavobacteriales bacterium]
MRYVVLICRLIVGALFIVSGLIKANDPIGFGIKLEEYFAEAALNLTFLEPAKLFLAILACVAEIVLGFAVLFGGRMKVAVVALLWLTIFFGWLTAYTATCDPQGTYTVIEKGVEVTKEVHCVTDCGCFGDAMKGSIGRSLTPWESFVKDLVLFILIIPIAIAAFRKPGIRWNTGADDKVLLPLGLVLVAFFCWVFTWWGPLWFTLVGFAGYLGIKQVVKGAKAEWITALWAAVLSLGFIWYCIAHNPVRDYRPYAVGKSIAAQRAEGKAPVNEIFLTYKNSRTGEVKEFPSTNYPWQDSTWVFVEQRVNELVPGIDSQVKDFVLMDKDGNDLTDGILAETQPVLLVILKSCADADVSDMPAIVELAKAAQDKGWYVYGVSASPWEEIEEFRHTNQTPFEFAQCDEVTLKTVNRANPGIMLLKEGVVKGQWHHNDTPSFEEAAEAVK